jgi:hypothetical protein
MAALLGDLEALVNPLRGERREALKGWLLCSHCD